MPIQYFRFGIPSLDRLLGTTAGETTTPGGTRGFALRPRDDEAGTESICVSLIGADGTGKSLLALHAAAQWLRSTDGAVKVVYASTDLSVHRANGAWHDFALGNPARVADPFERQCDDLTSPSTMSIQEVSPYGDDCLLITEGQGDADTPWQSSIQFLDLRSHSRGDNWGFLNRVVAALPATTTDQPLHMVVLDGIDGLEASGGDVDIHGLQRDRRSRIAQLLRTARGRCHVVLTVADSPNNDHPAEAYLADLVLRMRYETEQGYQRRVLAVEKARGQGHKRGIHPYFIRSGQRSTTGFEANPDDPEVRLPNDRRHAYIFVAPSLHLRNRELMLLEDKPIEMHDAPRVAFGCRYLDDMLGGGVGPSDERHDAKASVKGIPAQTPTALIGEDGTFKSNLSKAFLAEALRPTNGETSAIVLITTKILDREGLAVRMVSHLNDPDAVERALPRIFVRRLEVHFISPAMFLHILEQCVRAAQRTVLSEDDMRTESARRIKGHRVRLVIDNWTVIQQTYPELAEERRLLPTIMMFLRREGIATLILANEDAGFSEGFRLNQCRTLRDLTSLHIFTWLVPFNGQARIAITVTPPQKSDRRIVIRELRVRQGEHGVPDVVPEFELFEGLEKGEPRFVPLRLHVFTAQRDAALLPAKERRSKATRTGDGNPRPPADDEDVSTDGSASNATHSTGYWTQFRQLAERLLGDERLNLVPHHTQEDYEILKDMSSLVGPTRSAESVVMMLDEFWAKRDGPQAMQLQVEHLRTPVTRVWQASKTARFEGKADARRLVVVEPPQDKDRARTPEIGPDLIEDPFRLFQPTEDQRAEAHGWSRVHCFETVGYDLAQYIKHHAKSFIKVPFYWDFGFLMCDQRAWATSESAEVDEIWKRFASKQPLNWRDFADALRVVAAKTRDRLRAARPDQPPITVHGLALPSDAGETLSCLLLEVWASEIGTTSPFGAERHEDPKYDLPALIRAHATQLLSALMLVKDMVGSHSIDTFTRKVRAFDPKREVCVAARCWYSTATCLQRIAREDAAGRGEQVDFVPVSLPGSYSVRGDWFLGVTRGSRSVLLARRTMDLLNSRRGNIVRLQEGIGLPVRGNKDPDARELWTALTRPSDASGEPHGPRRHYHYREIRDLGARTPSEKDKAGRDDLRWIWRSRIKNYDLHARIWRRWVCTTLANIQLPPTFTARQTDSQHEAQRELFEELKKGLLETLGRATIHKR